MLFKPKRYVTFIDYIVKSAILPLKATMRFPAVIIIEIGIENRGLVYVNYFLASVHNLL